MERKEIFHHFSNLLDTIIDSSDFFKVYFQSCYLLDEDVSFSSNLALRTGATRGCLVDQTYDYVVKFDLINFDGLCEKEQNICLRAHDYQVDQFFAPSCYIGTYTKTLNYYHIFDIEEIAEWLDEEDFYCKLPDIESACEKTQIQIEIPLYAYPRAKECILHHTQHDADIASQSTSPLRGRLLAIAATFINDYGVEAYNKLTKFLYDQHIDDIHIGNVGEINGHICIIDYASYGDETDVSSLS